MSALAHLVDYDPVTHDFDACASFDMIRPAAIPAVTDVLPAVKVWIEGVTENRLHFYSAREEQEPPAKAPAKKGPATKKITNHAIMEHLAALGSQLQALQTQQEELRKGAAASSSAIPVGGLGTHVPATSKMPSLSAGLPAMQTPVAGVSKLLGPPPKVKPPVALGVVAPEVPIEPNAEEQEPHQDSIVRAISQQSVAITSLVAHLAGGDALTELSSSGLGAGGSLSSKGVARRERMQQDLAERQSTYFLQVQQQLFRRMNPSLPVPKTEQELLGYGATMTSYMEKQGGLQEQQGPRSWSLDCCSCHGFGNDGRHAWVQGVPCAADSLYGTGLIRRELECGFSPFVVGNAPSHGVFGEGSQCPRTPASIQPLSSTAVGRMCPIVHEGGRCVGHKEAGTEDSEAKHPEGQRSRRHRQSKPKATSQVPEAAQRVVRPEGIVVGSDDSVSQEDGRPSSCMPGVVSDRVDFCKGYDDIFPVYPNVDDSRLSYPHDVSSKKPRSKLHVSPDEPVSRGQHLLSYSRWCSTLVPEVLKTRTPFGAFLARTIQLSKCLSSDLAPTFFPLPIPPGYWHEMPAVTSAHRRRSIHRSRALHVIVMALNFWHSGGVFIDDHLLQRAPNSLHNTLFKRIRALLKSDGPSSAFQATKAGRRFPELIARIGELSEVLTCNGCNASPYSKSFTGTEVPKDDSTMPELRPYTDLDPSRLTLSGTGKFDATGFLSDPLVMPYRDPAVLALPGPAGIKPKIRDDPSTVGKLAKLWDSQGLLLIHNKQTDPDRFVRVFNAYKSPELDRQIGDRRGANSLEARISDFGPSCCLPSGSDISELSLDPRKQKLSICITDRKDFYHQFWITRRKALANTVGPVCLIVILQF